MSKARLMGKVAAASTVLGLAVVPVANAYTVPGAPGTPGGKPTAPKGGSSSSKSAVKTAAQSIAGYTGLELALRTPSVRFFFPQAGTVACTLKPGKTEIGSGGTSKAAKGYKTFNLNLSNSGRTYLYKSNGTALAVTVKCTFVPSKGKTATSTATVVLDG